MAELDLLQRAAEVIDTVGTIGLAVVIVWAFYTRRITTAKEQVEHDGEHSKTVAYIEARRAEEREARVAAEKRLGDLIESIDNIASVIEGVKEEIIRTGVASARRGTRG